MGLQLPPRRVHHCHVRTCRTECPPEHLMCAAHWKKVPKPLQEAVYKHYRPGQCEDMNVSPEWVEAAEAAISYVEALERRATAQGSFKF